MFYMVFAVKARRKYKQNREAVATAGGELGTDTAAKIVEQALAQLAKDAVEQGVRQLVVAGDKSTLEVAQALALDSLRVGAEITRGVPWTYADHGKETIAIAFNPGNPGAEHFFSEAFAVLNDKHPRAGDSQNDVDQSKNY